MYLLVCVCLCGQVCEWVCWQSYVYAGRCVCVSWQVSVYAGVCMYMLAGVYLDLLAGVCICWQERVFNGI